MNFRCIKRRVLLWSSTLLLTLFATGSILAQDLDVCRRIIAQSLTDMGVNCANNETGMACYGSGSVTSVLDSSMDESTFDEPGEMINISDAVMLSPGAFNETEQSWGTTVINMQANLPTGFESDVIILGFGGTDIENAVERESFFQALSAPITVTTTQNSALRAVTLADPDNAAVNGQVTSGALLPADAISEDGEWVRVVFNEIPSWISRTSLEGDFDSLPTYGPNNLSAFQAFDITSGLASSDDSSCEQAPSVVYVQGPSDIPVDIIVNGVSIRIESTILLRTLGSQLEIITLFGMATLNADTRNPIYAPPGFPLLVALGDRATTPAGSLGRFSPPRSFGLPTLITQGYLNIFSFIDRLPSNLLNYIANLPRLVIPSGIGQVIRRLIFRNPQALRIARRLCDNNVLSDEICTILGL